MLEDGDMMEITDMDLAIDGSLGKMKAKRFGYSSLDSTFNIGSFNLDCNILSGDLTDIDNYIASCLTKGDVTTNQLVPFGFHQGGVSEETGDPLDVTIKGKMRSLGVKDEKLAFVTDKFSLNVSNEFFLDFDQMVVNCQKDPKQVALDIPLILEHCKKGMLLDSKDIQFQSIDDKNESTRGQLDTRTLNVMNQKLNFDILRLKMIDKESRKLIRSMRGQCGLNKNTDIFDVSDIVDGCSSNLNVNIEAMFTDEKTTGQNTLKSSGFNIYQYKIEESKPGLTDVRLKIVERQLAASMKVRVLGMNFSVRFQGNTSWDTEKQILTLNVTHSRLPLGITSRGLFMYIAKKFMQSDMISFGSNNQIYIKL